MLRSINWYLVALSWLTTIMNAQTTTPPYTYRTNPDFPTTGLITTPESLQGTINTDTRVTSTTRLTSTTPTQQTTSTSSTTQQPQTTTNTAQSQPGISTTATQPIESTTTTGQLTVSPAPTTGNTAEASPAENVYFSTSTIYTTHTIQDVAYSTQFSTVTLTFQVPSTATDYATVTDADKTETIYTTSTSQSTFTTTISKSATTSNWQELTTLWSESLITSLLTLPYPSLSLEISTITNTQTHTYYEPVELVTSGYSDLVVNLPNATYTSHVYVTYTETSFLQSISPLFSYDYSSITHTGTQYATLSFTDGLWLGITDFLDFGTTIEYQPITITSTEAFEFIHGLTTITNYKTVTNLIASTTVYSTFSSYITSTVTQYVQNDETAFPITTVTFTFTSTATPAPVTVTSSIAPTTQQPISTSTADLPITSISPTFSITIPTVTVSAPSSIATVTSTTSIFPTDCIASTSVAQGTFQIQEENAGIKLWVDLNLAKTILIGLFVSFFLI